ncbi:MAG: hypothetical protein JWN34_4040 [Bryobacterales bacterium]|nr:hypothetical protein [Bryobacterales bacterium]
MSARLGSPGGSDAVKARADALDGVDAKSRDLHRRDTLSVPTPLRVTNCVCQGRSGAWPEDLPPGDHASRVGPGVCPTRKPSARATQTGKEEAGPEGWIRRFSPECSPWAATRSW